MLRTSGHDDQHADNASFGGQDAPEALSGTSENEARNLSFAPSNDDEAIKKHPVEVILSGDEMPVDDSTLHNITPVALEEEAKKTGLLQRIFNKKALGDLATGMAIGGVARYGVILLGTGGLAVGAAGFGVMAAAGIAAGVARTAWTVQKDRKAYEAKTGESISFWDWAKKQELDEEGNLARDENGKVKLNNKKKYLIALGASTALATLGSAFATYAVPHIAEWAAPLIDRAMKSETVVAIGGFFAAAWKDIAGGATPPVVAVPTTKVDADTIKRGSEAFEKMMNDNGPKQTLLSPDAIQRRIEEAHDVVKGAVPTPAVAPILSVSDRVSMLADKADLSQRWEGIAARAVGGNAQAQKDVASALLNGTHGFDKNPAEAAALYRAAADAGNMQAKVDLAYMQFHGLGGIKPDTKAALETIREHATGNEYARAVLGNLTGEGAVQNTTSSALNRAVDASITPPAAELVQPNPVAVTSVGQIPDGATLDVTWNQNAEGVISGTVKNAPVWLKDGMVIDVPTAQVQ